MQAAGTSRALSRAVLPAQPAPRHPGPRQPGADTGRELVLLTPGAGASRDNHTLVALERALAPLPCARVDFPYRIAGRRAPDRAPVAIAHLVE